jgi:hypothetical protein
MMLEMLHLALTGLVHKTCLLFEAFDALNVNLQVISPHACHLLKGAGPTTRALSTPPAGRGAIHRCIKLQQPARRRLCAAGH